jgi:hypothetical protein
MCFKTANQQRRMRQHLPKSVHNVQHNLWSKDIAIYYWRYSLNASSLILLHSYNSDTILFPLSAAISHTITTQMILCIGRTTEPRLWLACQFPVEYQIQIIIIILSPYIQNITWLILAIHGLSDFKNTRLKLDFKKELFQRSQLILTQLLKFFETTYDSWFF